MKKSTTTLFLIFLSTLLSAQSLIPVKYGIKAGINISNIISTPIEEVKNTSSSFKIGPTGGFYIQIALNDKWYINPEILYSQKGSTLNYEYTNDKDTSRTTYSVENNITVSYVELNPTISYKTNSKVSLNFGPSINYLISVNDKSIEDPENNLLDNSKFDEESLDIGLNIGLSYNISEKFLINTNLCTGFMKIGTVQRPIDSSEDPAFSIKNYNFTISSTYLF